MVQLTSKRLDSTTPFPFLLEVAASFRSSFESTGVFPAMFGKASDADRDDCVARNLLAALQKPTTEHIYVVYKTEGETLKLIGHGHFSNITGDDHTETTQLWPEGCDRELSKQLFGRMAAAARLITYPHYHFNILAIDPLSQGIGAGSFLLKQCMREANLLNVPVHLDATDAGIPMYEKLGFTKFGEPIVAGRNDEFSLLPMIKLPQAVI